MGRSRCGWRIGICRESEIWNGCNRPIAVHHPHRANPRMWQPLPAEMVETSPAAFRDLLVVVKYSTAGGKLLFTMIFGSLFHGIVGSRPEW